MANGKDAKKILSQGIDIDSKTLDLIINFVEVLERNAEQSERIAIGVENINKFYKESDGLQKTLSVFFDNNILSENAPLQNKILKLTDKQISKQLNILWLKMMGSIATIAAIFWFIVKITIGGE